MVASMIAPTTAAEQPTASASQTSARSVLSSMGSTLSRQFLAAAHVMTTFQLPQLLTLVACACCSGATFSMKASSMAFSDLLPFWNPNGPDIASFQWPSLRSSSVCGEMSSSNFRIERP
jgi:hypothetical protein